jgi:dTDP-4-amino-4,6-dideoxygalactose transaminase
MSPSETGARPVPLLDLKPQYASIRAEILARVAALFESQHFILGEEVAAFERELAAYCSVPFAVGCASGSDALILALRALGIGRGDKVLTTPYSFFATAGSIAHTGATPVFADVDPATFNLDPARVAEFRGVRAIIAVHLYGGCADMDRIRDAAPGIPVIEDAAQAIGAEYKNRRAGSMGAIGCFSFFPSKNLGAFGDGGAVTVNDPALAVRLQSLRVHGSTTKYVHDEIGYNSRLDAIQAAVLRVKLPHLDQWTAGRQANAELYRTTFKARKTPVIAPVAAAYQTRHIYNQFVIRCERRDQLREYLKSEGIGTEVYYPIPLHLQPCFADLGYRPGDLPVAEQLARESLALPVHPDLTSDDIETVAAAVHRFYSQPSENRRAAQI